MLLNDCLPDFPIQKERNTIDYDPGNNQRHREEEIVVHPVLFQPFIRFFVGLAEKHNQKITMKIDKLPSAIVLALEGKIYCKFI
jgi:hypothetical protein